MASYSCFWLSLPYLEPSAYWLELPQSFHTWLKVNNRYAWSISLWSLKNIFLWWFVFLWIYYTFRGLSLLILKSKRNIVICNLLVDETCRLPSAPDTGVTESSLYTNTNNMIWGRKCLPYAHVFSKTFLCLYTALERFGTDFSQHTEANSLVGLWLQFCICPVRTKPSFPYDPPGWWKLDF